ncbi:hypothetical protein GCM10023185_09940 [Hymenobacter saemangeumensis]|uniref:SbsA Ig-like domain-containing protein n=1 Tax=Hymenobacter saemangeumensis TaxID=1084522 RepID=A0ABP8I4Q5_9BACT
MSVRADLLALLAFAALLEGCAAVAPPQGGPRDTVPPRLISSSPDSAARNVKQRYVRLVFSEAIQLKELSKNLLITPQLPADNPYKLREERNAVTLLFDKPLDENTTYSFNFRDAVVDATESLPARNAVLSFSTGAVLDSGAVRGSVADVLTTQPVADAVIGLYRASDTASVRRAKPYYLTRTDKQGQFALSFLKAGRYRIYALADKNQDGRYQEGEKIAYLAEPITVGGKLAEPIALQLTQPDRRGPLLASQQPGPTSLRLNFNEGLRAAALAPLPTTTPAAAQSASEALLLTEKGRTLLVFKTPALAEGRYLLTATDSTGNASRDTLNVRFSVPAATARKAAATPLYAVEGTPRSVYRQGQVVFRFQVPVRIAPGRPFGTLVEDSTRRKPLALPANGTLSPDRTLLTVRLDTRAKSRVDVLLDSTAVTAVTGQSLQLRPLRLSLTEEAPTGTLSGTITTQEPRFELQLLDEKLQVVQSLASPKGSYRFDNIAPGTYRLRALIDRNGDGRWNGGDSNLLLPPEPVYLHSKSLQLRANWEVEEKLSF